MPVFISSYDVYYDVHLDIISLQYEAQGTEAAGLQVLQHTGTSGVCGDFVSKAAKLCTVKMSEVLFFDSGNVF